MLATFAGPSHGQVFPEVVKLVDLDGNGIDDLIVGAYRASPDGRKSAGSSCVVFGRRDALFLDRFESD